MIIEIANDAQKVLEDFLYYSKLHTEAMADVMDYDHDGFRQRIKLLQKVVETAKSKKQ